MLIAGGHNGVIFSSEISHDNELGKEAKAFKITKSAIDNFEEKFHETLYEHQGPITAIETNPLKTDVFLSSSLDSTVQIWSCAETEIKYLDSMKKVQVKAKGRARVGGVTKARWLDEQTILSSLSDGSIWMKDFREGGVTNQILESDSKIWDLAKSGEHMYAIASDSGSVDFIDLRNPG